MIGPKWIFEAVVVLETSVFAIVEYWNDIWKQIAPMESVAAPLPNKPNLILSYLLSTKDPTDLQICKANLSGR